MPRKQKKYHYIYKTTNNITGKYYYGMHSTNNLDDGYVGSGTKLWKSIDKYGRDNHSVEILEYLDNRKLLKAREKELITIEMLNDPMCMNLAFGGQGGYVSERQARLGAYAMHKVVENDPEYRKRRSIRSSELMKRLNKEGKVKAPDWTGKKHSAETKKRMSESAKKRTREQNSQYGTCWVTKLGESKKIKKYDIDQYISEGWSKGRVINKNKNESVSKTCPNCDSVFIVAYNKRHQECCSRSCASSFSRKK